MSPQCFFALGAAFPLEAFLIITCLPETNTINSCIVICSEKNRYQCRN